MSRLYREQTGRELSDYILVQQADKVVRYNQFPPDAEFVRRAVLNSCSSPASEATSDFSARFKARLNFGAGSSAALETSGDVSGIAEGRARVQPRKTKNGAKKREIVTASKQHLLDNHDPNVLLSTNELATLIGFRPKTIRRWVSRKILSYIRVGNRCSFQRHRTSSRNCSSRSVRCVSESPTLDIEATSTLMFQWRSGVTPGRA